MNSAKIISSLCCVMAFFVSAMDEAPKPFAISSYGPITTSLSNISQCAASSWDSLKNTIVNNISDTAAFKKLGWPPHDIDAQKELAISTATYERYAKSIQQQCITYDGFDQDYQFIERRYEYCQRALRALGDHPEGIKLALHCMEHHKNVMKPFDFMRFLLFVQLNKKTCQQEVYEIDQKLKQLSLQPKVDQ